MSSIKTTSEKLEFFTKVFGKPGKFSDGVNAPFCCPRCNKNKQKKKFTVRLDNDISHCFVCGLKGRNLKSIIREFNNKYLKEYVEDFLNEDSLAEEIEEEEIKLHLPEGFKLLSLELDNNSPDIKAALRYLKERNISERDMWYYKFGISKSNPTYKRRVIMPSVDETGELNFYTARSIDNSDWMKYLNASIDKVDIIFNEVNIDWSKELTIVEGPFDLVKCDNNSTCALGSYISPRSKLFQKIIENQTPIILSFDSDAIDKMMKVAKNLYNYDIRVKILILKGDRDIGDLTKKEFLEVKKTAKIYSPRSMLSHKISKIASRSLL